MNGGASEVVERAKLTHRLLEVEFEAAVVNHFADADTKPTGCSGCIRATMVRKEMQWAEDRVKRLEAMVARIKKERRS